MHKKIIAMFNQAIKQSSSRSALSVILFLILLLSINTNAFSQLAIGSSDADPDGYLYHRQGITIGDNLSPSYNLLLVKKQTYEQQVFMQVANTTLTGYTPTDGFLIGINKDTAILNQQENADLIFKTNATNRAVIKNNGYVGIGIMEPAHTLHVHSNGTIGGGLGGGHGLKMEKTTSKIGAKSNQNNKLLGISSNVILGTTDPVPYAAIQLTNTATGTNANDGLLIEMKNENAIINLQEKGSISFRNANDVSLYISKDHTVGIGTTNTYGYKFAVRGAAHFFKIVVNTHYWSDDVFDEDYKLRSLAELGNYIKTCKHLPGIPSESEVKKNGIDVADMNKRLLQKVEELTLYIIDLQKQIDELKKQVNKQ